MKFFCVLSVLCGLGFPAFAIEREAFTFTNYDLKVRVEPEQQRLAVRGRITLRNDSAAPQKNVALQISSSLDWRSVQLAGKALQFVAHNYVSDIDHTGALSEAIVTLPHDVPPKAVLELEIGYEGIIPLDATRLVRIGVPEDKAKHSDWDQISTSFTAVRGIGYVAWYPVGTESANLSEGSSVDEAVGRWKVRQADSTMSVVFESSSGGQVFFSGAAESPKMPQGANIAEAAAFKLAKLGISAPTFVIANYQKLAPSTLLTVQYLPGQEEAAKAYADEASQPGPIVAVGGALGSLQILGLPDPDAAPFVSEGMLLCPLKAPTTNDAVLSIAYARARQLVSSQRAWVQDGLAHYAQAAFIESRQGRQTALDYMSAHAPALVEAEKSDAGRAGGQREKANSLVNAPDNLYLGIKGMYVWWMLEDMLGGALDQALLSYRAAEDNDGAYIQRLMEKAAHRDLQWFFDDWVYRDRGLPDFRVESAYVRPVVDAGYMVTITIENLGAVGAEVPVTLRIEGGEITKRVVVQAKSKASIRVEAASVPQEVVVNDGSVPESDMTNNTYKVEPLSQ